MDSKLKLLLNHVLMQSLRLDKKLNRLKVKPQVQDDSLRLHASLCRLAEEVYKLHPLKNSARWKRIAAAHENEFKNFEDGYYLEEVKPEKPPTLKRMKAAAYAKGLPYSPTDFAIERTIREEAKKNGSRKSARAALGRLERKAKKAAASK